MVNPIVLRRTDSIGAADAENDHQFLSQCFVDSGQLDLLLNIDEPHCVILGRTGSGKTALLLVIKKRYQIHNEERQRDFWTRCRDYFARDKNKAKAKEDALRYLEYWGRNFWEETTTRVKEFTNKLESELSADAHVDLKTIKLGAK